MLPDVDPEQRSLAVHDGRVLVRGRQDGESGAVPDEPGPAAAEPLDACVVHLLLERVDPAEGRLDRVGERARRLPAAVRAHDLPEEAVVRVSASVVADGGALLLGDDLEARENAFDRSVHPFRSLERGVQIRDVGGVVAVVVDLHRHRVDVRLERVEVVRQWGDAVGHLPAPLFGPILASEKDMLRGVR